MSHQGKGGLFFRARFGLDNFGEDVLYPQAHRSRVRGLGARLLTSAVKLGAEFGGLSRWAPPAGSRAGRAPVRRHPCQEVCPHRPHGRAMPSRRRAAGEAAAEGCATGPAEGRPPRAAERVPAAGGRASERAGRRDVLPSGSAAVCHSVGL